jgi:hypothetical protein
LDSNCCVFVRRRVGERMTSACVVPTVKHGGGVVMCEGALLVTLTCIVLSHPQSSHLLPWWQLCTLLAFSQPVSWSNYLEWISIYRCDFFKAHFEEYFSSMLLR